MAEPLDLVDPKSGMDYFEAGKLLSQATIAGATTVQPIPYWEDLFPYLATGGQSATQNIYTNVYQPQAVVGNHSYALAVLDAYCDPNQGAAVLDAARMRTPTGMSQHAFTNGSFPRSMPGPPSEPAVITLCS